MCILHTHTSETDISLLSDQQVTKTILDRIHSHKKGFIGVSLFIFTNIKLAEALAQALTQGIAVHVRLSLRFINSPSTQKCLQLIKHGAHIDTVEAHHDKTFIFSDTDPTKAGNVITNGAVITGSTNGSYFAHRNREDDVIINDNELAQETFKLVFTDGYSTHQRLPRGTPEKTAIFASTGSSQQSGKNSDKEDDAPTTLAQFIAGRITTSPSKKIVVNPNTQAPEIVNAIMNAGNSVTVVAGAGQAATNKGIAILQKFYDYGVNVFLHKGNPPYIQHGKLFQRQDTSARGGVVCIGTGNYTTQGDKENNLLVVDKTNTRLTEQVASRIKTLTKEATPFEKLTKDEIEEFKSSMRNHGYPVKPQKTNARTSKKRKK